MIFSHKNLQKCKWSKCDKGVYRGYHTPVEWEKHRQYVKIDLPPPIYPVQFEQPIEYYHEPQPTTDSSNRENLYYTNNIVQQKSSRKLQYAAVGTMLAVWGTVIWSIVRLI